ncbi:MAG: DUF1311 domain-containing protein [Immundisolibacter sp.]|uniref:lysozyme inhibitor LprI family protein n=1 Tax=Immundisolibacter sp. TaxID=1934948 RepID=UPI0019CC404C|nr:lysozyme inhibitor LprI family protein [Immundisolibacter sp.]MBC7160548.1 DUF1311 domain-containing protein [Immundisolibacter sp.]
MSYRNIGLMFVVAGSVAFGWADSSEMTCVEGGNQLQLNFCAGDDFKKADGEMNALYKEQINYLKDPAKTRLKQSQRAWIAFRDKACLYESGPQEESGSIWPMEMSRCLWQHTKQRIEDLKSYVACRENGCPY